jgi:cell division protein FtsL
MHIILGLSIAEWAETLTALGVLVSAGSWLFKKIALDPLREDIQRLSEQIGQQLKVHEQTLASINGRIKEHDKELGSHSERITRLEDHAGIKGDDEHED